MTRPLCFDEIEEFLSKKAVESPEWAQAWATCQVARSVGSIHLDMDGLAASFYSIAEAIQNQNIGGIADAISGLDLSDIGSALADAIDPEGKRYPTLTKEQAEEENKRTLKALRENGPPAGFAFLNPNGAQK